MEKVDKAINKLLSDNVTIKFYMFGSLMKSGILGNVNSRIVVTKGNVWSEKRKNANPEEGIESIEVHKPRMPRRDTQP